MKWVINILIKAMVISLCPINFSVNAYENATESIAKVTASETLYRKHQAIFTNPETLNSQKLSQGQAFAFDINETEHPEISALTYLQLMHLNAKKTARPQFKQWQKKLDNIVLSPDNAKAAQFLSTLFEIELTTNEGQYLLAISQSKQLVEQLQHTPYLDNTNYFNQNIYVSALNKTVLFNILGMSFFKTSDYESAQSYFLKSMKIYEDNKIFKGMYAVYNNLSMISWAQKDYKKAILLVKKSLEVTREIKNDVSYITGLSNLGIYYAEDKQYDNALASYNKVLAHSDINQYSNIKIKTLLAKSEVLQLTNEYEKSETLINQALLMSQEINDVENLVIAKIAMGDLLTKRNLFTKALALYQQAKAYYEQEQLAELELQTLLKISELYKKQGNLEQAIAHYEKYNLSSIELLKSAQKATMLGLSEKYQADAREKEIQLLKQKNKIVETTYAKEINEKTFNVFAICSAIIVLLLLISKYFSYQKNKELKQFNEKIKANEKQLLLLSHAFSNTSDAVWITNEHFEIEAVNNAFVKHTHKTKHEVIGKKVSFAPIKGQHKNFADTIMLHAKIHDTWHGELFDVRSNDEIYPLELEVETIRNDNEDIIHYLGVFRDITERKKSEEKLAKLATHDELTGLPNRALLDQLVQQSCLNAKYSTRTPTILLLDVNNFKKINESLGHLVGDQLISEISKRLKSTLFLKDIISRLNGAEYCILVELNDPKRRAPRVAQKILSVFDQPFELEGTSLNISASIGITLYPDDSDTSEGLIRKAGIAMTEVKKTENQQYRFFEQRMNEALVTQLEQEQKLLTAIINQRFQYYYQPLVNIKTGKVSGAEALIRGIDDDGNIISPEQFIPIAEKAGFIDQIDRITINNVFQQIASWQKANVNFGTISINLSAKMFSQTTELLNLLQAKISELSINTHQIKIEITESMVLSNVNQAIETMENIKALGFQLALDDFGTGFSSLNYLKKFPIDILKIDRSFIMGMHESATDRSIVQSIISLAHTLNLTVVGEGVELEQHLSELQQLECEEYQGYLYSKPLPLSSFESLLINPNKALDEKR